MSDADKAEPEASHQPEPDETAAEKPLKLKRVIARARAIDAVDNPRRAQRLRLRLATDVLAAIADGRVKRSRLFAAAALGRPIDIDAPKGSETES